MLYKYKPKSEAKIQELETYQKANYYFPSGFVKQDSGFKVFSEAFAAPLIKLYDNIMTSVFDKGPVQLSVMSKLFPKNKVLKNFYEFIVGSFIIFFRHRKNIVGLVKNALEVKNMSADFGKALYRSLCHGVNPVQLLMQLGLIQPQRNEWRMSDPTDNLKPEEFITVVMKVLLYENEYFHKVFGITSEKDINMFLLGGEVIVNQIVRITKEYDLYESILTNSEAGKNAISRLKKDIDVSWKTGFSNWGKMLPILINPSSAITFLSLFDDVENKNEVIEELKNLKQKEEQTVAQVLGIEEI